jgi:hypothetical protein
MLPHAPLQNRASRWTFATLIPKALLNRHNHTPTDRKAIYLTPEI